VSLIGFIYFSAYAVLFGLLVNWGKAHFSGGPFGAALAAVH
jgi:hypothetical protein